MENVILVFDVFYLILIVRGENVACVDYAAVGWKLVEFLEARETLFLSVWNYTLEIIYDETFSQIICRFHTLFVNARVEYQPIFRQLINSTRLYLLPMPAFISPLPSLTTPFTYLLLNCTHSSYRQVVIVGCRNFRVMGAHFNYVINTLVRWIFFSLSSFDCTLYLDERAKWSFHRTL